MEFFIDIPKSPLRYTIVYVAPTFTLPRPWSIELLSLTACHCLNLAAFPPDPDQALTTLSFRNLPAGPYFPYLQNLTSRLRSSHLRIQLFQFDGRRLQILADPDLLVRF